ncbi:DUF2358-containing protein [Fragilaria crotonensis]|nr:DUF2358-containing protein [Fragilaria crotonensis]
MKASIALLLVHIIIGGEAFPPSNRVRSIVRSNTEVRASPTGIVSILTDLVNRFSLESIKEVTLDLPPSPQSPSELATRIRDDYTVRNYLWTGDIDLACFDENCQFTDPTISFTSRDTFVRNTQNLKVLVDKLATGTKSELLEITVNDEYVESRWNMVGDLTGLFWKPRIDVIGRTKFWYKIHEDGGVRVYFYDESWEIPAGEALLQLITPAGKAS